MVYSGRWASKLELEHFLNDIPDRFSEYGSIQLRVAPNKFDPYGTRSLHHTAALCWHAGHSNESRCDICAGSQPWKSSTLVRVVPAWATSRALFHVRLLACSSWAAVAVL